MRFLVPRPHFLRLSFPSLVPKQLPWVSSTEDYPYLCFKPDIPNLMPEAQCKTERERECMCVCVCVSWETGGVCVCVCVSGRMAYNWNTFSSNSITKSWFKTTILVLFCSIFQSHMSCFYLSEPYLSNICRHVK